MHSTQYAYILVGRSCSTYLLCLSEFNPFLLSAMGALDSGLGLFLFTFLPESTVHNMRISDLGVPGLYIYCPVIAFIF